MTQMYEVQVRFRTAKALSQGAGMKFWEHGNHFASLPGRSSYQLTTRGEAESMVDAIMGVCLIIDALVAEDIPRWPSVEYLGVSSNSTADLISG